MDDSFKYTCLREALKIMLEIAEEKLASYDKQAPLYSLEKTDASYAHDLLSGVVVNGEPDGNPSLDDVCEFPLSSVMRTPPLSTIVIGHDWARLLRDSLVVGLPFSPMPFPHMLYEATINGRRFIMDVEQDGDDTALSFRIFVRVRERLWAMLDAKRNEDLTTYLANQIEAISIMLESGVAGQHLVSAPSKLNKARAAKGRHPLLDYHIVTLSAKHKRERGDGETGVKVRLHFRRGHWYHPHPGVKQWRKWCLVGDPALGWVDKEYRA